MAACNDTTRKVIDDYRLAIIKALYKIKGEKKNVGVWGPACIQHGFSDEGSFANEKYKVPSASGS